MVVAVMIMVCGALNENFFSTRNIANISAQISVTTILAFGETLLIIAGLLDLSCGSVLALAGVMSVYVYKQTGSMSAAFGAGILFGVLCNYLNGIMVRYVRIPAFIATLAMMAMARGCALLFTRGQNIYQIGDYIWFGQGMVGFVPIPVIFMIIVGVLTWYIPCLSG
jgi:inositol transport system permease protein